jgi:plastocyanin
VLGALALAGQASAADTYKVLAGEQARGPAGVPKTATLNQFFPAKLTVRAGDRVTFSSATFHTVTYVPRPPAIFVRDPAKSTYQDILDAAGEPFYFNGLPKLIYNPLALGPYGGTTVAGKKSMSTGALSPPGRKPVTATLDFPKPGVFRLLCNVHPGMKATVTVKPALGAVPLSPTQVQSKALEQVNIAWAKAKALDAAAKAPANTVYMGLGGNVELLTYYPRVLRVKVGTTVNFVNKSPSDIHNIVFGPKKYIQSLGRKIDLFPQGPNSPNQVAPVLPFGTEPKGQYSYDGQNHGNGFLVTPITAGSKTVPLPRASRVTFTGPGRFNYFCWIHGPDMKGTVVVTP